MIRRLIAAVVVASVAHAQSFTVADGLEVSVWARSPQLFNPTSLDVDASGRLWVAEAVNYRRFNDGGEERLHHDGGDRVLILEDTDGDGRCDSSKVFVQDPELVAPLGIAVIGERVFVSCSPSIFVYTDSDGDDKPDRREVFLTGFGGHDHDHALHAVVAGPDGRLYFNAGNAGPHVVTDAAGWTLRAGSFYTGGSPHNPTNTPGLRSDDGRVWVGGVALRIEVDGTGLAVIGHNFRNAFDLCVDSFGNVWQNDNDDTIGCRTTWLMERGNLGYASNDGRRSWQAGQRPGQTVPTAHWRQDDPGVLPAGDVYGPGSPTGIAFYENGSLGPQWPGTLLSCEAGRNVVWAYRPKTEGAGYRLERSRFLAAADDDPDYVWHAVPEDRRKWFRPSDVAVGTDGTVYVADWFDPIVGGHQMRDRQGEGTIYRVTARGDRPRAPRLDGGTTAAAIEALRSPASNVRALGVARLARETNALPAVAALTTDTDRFVRARAAWLLPRLGERGVAAARALLRDADPDLRITALRALRQRGLDPSAQLIDDDSAAVRREAALAMREVPLAACSERLLALARGFDGTDRWYLEALGTACEGREAAAYALLHEALGDEPLRWSKPFAALAWRLHPAAAVDAFRQRANASELPLAERVRTLTALAFVDDDAAAQTMVALAAGGPADTHALALWWLQHPEHESWRANAGVRAAVAAEERPQMLLFESELLRRGEVAIDVDITGARRLALVVSPGDDGIDYDWADWIEPTLVGPDGDLRLTGLPWKRATAGWGEVRVDRNCEGGSLIVGGRPRAWGIGTHAASTIVFELPRTDLTRLRAIAGPDNHSVDRAGSSASMVFSVFADVRPNPPMSSLAKADLPPINELARMTGDAERGQALFAGAGACAACHRVGEAGGNIGPDLSSIAGKYDRAALLEAIVDPSASIATGYETTIVETTDGEVVVGTILEDGEPLLLRDAAGTEHRLAAARVARRKPHALSLMPVPALTAPQIADLIAFLEARAR